MIDGITKNAQEFAIEKITQTENKLTDTMNSLSENLNKLSENYSELEFERKKAEELHEKEFNFKLEKMQTESKEIIEKLK